MIYQWTKYGVRQGMAAAKCACHVLWRKGGKGAWGAVVLTSGWSPSCMQMVSCRPSPMSTVVRSNTGASVIVYKAGRSSSCAYASLAAQFELFSCSEWLVVQRMQGTCCADVLRRSLALSVVSTNANYSCKMMVHTASWYSSRWCT